MSITSQEYLFWVNDLKGKILSRQIKASISVNRELLSLYWEIGKSISDKIQATSWGSSIIESLASDLQKALPNQKGFSRSNLYAMKKWYEFYSSTEYSLESVQQLVGQIPWGHHVAIISKGRSIDEALFYCRKSLENNWSRSVLTHQIESGLYERSGKATTNFMDTLPKPHSELARESLKDPYKLDFLTLHEKAQEKDIEEQLVSNITSFLLELGSGFSFVGRQFPVKVGERDFFIDLLFYHFRLRCFVVVELKHVAFKAEFAGKMNMYLSAVDDMLKSESDNPTIGLLLCKSKSKIEAEYSLRGMSQPIGIAEYELSKAIPENMKSSLPTIEEIEEATSGMLRDEDQ